MPERVLLVDTLSGTNDYSVELAHALAARVELTVVTVASTELRNADGMRVRASFPAYGGSAARWRKAIAALTGTWALAQELWRHRHDTVHAQFMRFPLLELPLYLLMRPWLSRLVITVHNFLPHERGNWQARFYLRWYRLADRLHVLSMHIGRQLNGHLGIESSRIDVVPHGNYRRFRARNAARADTSRLGIPVLSSPDRVVIAFFGLIRPYKGLVNLARAFARVSSRNCALVVAGKVEDSAKAEMREVAQLMDDDPRFHLRPGFLDDPDLAALLTRADILAFPYTDISQSGALMLGMTYGKAVIANDIDGFREYLRDCETGMLCDTANSDAFAAVLEQLVSDAELRGRLGDKAAEEMESRYGWDTLAAAMVDCYRRADAPH